MGNKNTIIENMNITLKVYIVDETYGKSTEIDEKESSKKFKRDLEKEFSVASKETNIMPSADLPAFVTALESVSEYWPSLLALFFSAKRIRDNFEIWRQVAKKIRRFFTRPGVFLNREAAGVLAIHAVLDDFNELPNKMECIHYYWIHQWGEKKEDISDQSGIHPGPDDPHIGVAIHVFRIKVDHLEYEVTVDQKSVSLKRL